MVRDGIVRETIYDASEGRLVVNATQYLDQILDGVARDRENMARSEFKKVATLPAIVVEDLIKREIYDDPDAFDRWLNSSEAEPWRVWQGRI
jgi:hypothetical protein